MFSFRWFRSAVRNRMAPIPKDTAKLWRDRLSIVYMIIGFNMMGLIVYVSKREKLELLGNSDMSRIDRFKTLADGSNLTVVEVSGLTVKKSYEVTPTES